MPTRKGAGGRQQNYDSKGRYCKTQFLDLSSYTVDKAERKRIKRINTINMFCIKAEKKGDLLVKEILLKIEKAIPNSIQSVNDVWFDEVNNKMRELDIVTQKVVVEVKSGSARRCLRQLLEQKQYAQNKNKKHVLFAPNIKEKTKQAYAENGIEIKTTSNDLIKYIKENNK